MAKPAAAYRVRGPLVELTLARIRELTREPEAVFWVFVFPSLLTAILGLAFRSRPPEALPVAVVAGPLAEARLAALAKTPVYSYDPTQPESRAARLAVDAALQQSAGRVDAFTAGSAQVSEPGSRY